MNEKTCDSVILIRRILISGRRRRKEKNDQPSKFDVKEQIEVITTATTTAKSITVHSRFHFKERPELTSKAVPQPFFRTFSVLIHNLCLNIHNEASKAANNVNKYPSTCT